MRKTTARVPQMPRTIAEMIWMAYADGADLEQCHPLMLNSLVEKSTVAFFHVNDYWNGKLVM